MSTATEEHLVQCVPAIFILGEYCPSRDGGAQCFLFWIDKSEQTHSDYEQLFCTPDSAPSMARHPSLAKARTLAVVDITTVTTTQTPGAQCFQVWFSVRQVSVEA